MNIYIKQLALAYFYNLGSVYDLSDLLEILGMQRSQLDIMLYELINSEYLSYDNYELKITEKGVLHLISNNINSCFEEFDDFNSKRENLPKLKINDIYVPKNFNKKINK